MMRILLNDCSVLLNLIASGCLPEIAEVTGWQFALCPAVRDETKKLRNPATGEMVSLDISPLIDSGLLQVLELVGEDEETLYVEQTLNVDDGEAMSIAIAVSRNLELAIDDRQAANHARRTFPELQQWSTPEILKRWVEMGGGENGRCSRAIADIEAKARYFPPKTHHLAGWWHGSEL